MKTIRLPDGEELAALGQGTWRMGENRATRAAEVAALRRGVERGMTLIDTAEMYGEGATETLVGEALKGMRDRVFLVSKAYPQNASKSGLPKACDASLRRLATDRIDLYLLHWRGGVPLTETVEVMEKLVTAGKIRRWGVSNFDVADMEDLLAAGGTACATNQILYNLSRRGPEFDLLPWLDAHGIPAMAYSPVEQGRLVANPKLAALAAQRGVTPAQMALAWVLARKNVIAIPKAGTVAHVEENLVSSTIVLTAEDSAALNAAFPAPQRRTSLEML